MESGIDPGQEYGQDYYSYEHGYEMPQYGSRRRLLPPPSPEEYGEVVPEAEEESEEEEWARRRMIKLVVDGEYESSSAGEDSAPESQRSRPRKPAGNLNGNIYIAQNGSVVRTRRARLPDSLAVPSPGLLGGRGRKAARPAVAREESVPLSTLFQGPFPAEQARRTPTLVTFAPCPVGAGKPPGTRLTSTAGLEPAADRGLAREGVEFHGDDAPSEEEQLWMGLHIPMTKL